MGVMVAVGPGGPHPQEMLGLCRDEGCIWEGSRSSNGALGSKPRGDDPSGTQGSVSGKGAGALTAAAQREQEPEVGAGGPFATWAKKANAPVPCPPFAGERCGRPGACCEGCSLGLCAVSEPCDAVLRSVIGEDPGGPGTWAPAHRAGVMAPACHVSRRSVSGASALLALRGGRRALALWARRVGRGLAVSSRQRRCAHSSPRGSVPVVLVGGSLTHREDARGVLTGPGRHSGRPKASAPPAERAGGPTRPALRSPASGSWTRPRGGWETLPGACMGTVPRRQPGV